ncbi:MAG: MoaD/ThiS family protein [Deltaproteobacteria bacterium]|jgi:thiamine biosynthesis protein ThiS|nr:MoaD/ThiS family protein [Deltaproteobacteria bacterium]
MEIELNGLKETIPENISIDALIDLFKEGDPDLIVEINCKYIFPKNYKTTTIMENDTIEFINPNLGG